jgi:hypothetical protein
MLGGMRVPWARLVANGLAGGLLLWTVGAAPREPAASEGAVADRAGEIQAILHAPCPADPRTLPLGEESGLVIDAARSEHLFRIGPYPVRLEVPVHWNQDPHHSQLFRNGLANLAWLSPLIADYRETGRTSSLQQALELMLDWARRQQLHGKRTAQAAWQSKVVGDRAAMISYLAAAASCEGLLHPTQANRIARTLGAHARWILRNRVRNNHDLFDSIGLLAIGRTFPGLHFAAHWRQTARIRFSARIRRRIVGSEGLWLENSAGYQYLMVSLLSQFVAVDARDSGLDKLLETMQGVASMLIEPDGQIAQFGDSNLLTPGPAEQARSQAQHGLFVLPRSGLAVVKDADSYLSVYSQFYNGAHKHSDDLSFDLYDEGHRIVSDTGMYDKDPGKIRNFVKSARAHSTLTADGKDFSRSSENAYGSGMMGSGEGDGWYAIQARNPLLQQQGVLHNRTYLYKPGVALILLDRVDSGSNHQYDRYLQLGPEITASRTGGAVAIGAPGLTGSIHSHSTAHPEAVSVTRGAPPGIGWTSPAYRQSVPRDTVDFSSRAAAATFVTTISLGDETVDALPGAVATHSATLVMRSDGQPDGALRVTRDGEAMSVLRTAP